MELLDARPQVQVRADEYARLLGYPPAHAVDGRAAELAADAAAWYAAHGRPWVYARQAEEVAAGDGAVVMDGVAFRSPRLQKILSGAAADGAVLVAVSAGPEAEAEAQLRWRDGKPDEYFFLEVYASAVVEHLIAVAAGRLCGWAESRGLAALPHYSPGYPQWDVADQPRLLGLFARGRQWARLPSGLESLESGMLRPKKSQLAVFGLTRQAEAARRLTELVPCRTCSLVRCQYRRLPQVAPPPRRRESPVAPAEPRSN